MIFFINFCELHPFPWTGCQGTIRQFSACASPTPAAAAIWGKKGLQKKHWQISVLSLCLLKALKTYWHFHYYWKENTQVFPAYGKLMYSHLSQTKPKLARTSFNTMLRWFYSLSLLDSRHTAASEQNSHTSWFITKAHILLAILNPHVILLLRQIYLNLSANSCKYRLCCLRMEESGTHCIREFKNHGFYFLRSCRPRTSLNCLKTPFAALMEAK